jgi:hypothetical protein
MQGQLPVLIKARSNKTGAVAPAAGVRLRSVGRRHVVQFSMGRTA